MAVGDRLALSYTELKKAVGFYLGYGRDTSAWNADVEEEVDDYVQSGYRLFLNPPPLPGQSVAHEWTFLRPTTTLATVANTWQYTLPADFGSLDGELWFSPADGAGHTLPLTNASRIGQKRGLASTPATGLPQLAALVALTSDGSDSQRWELQLWPTPNAVYTLRYRYVVLVNKLSDTNLYPYGGDRHAQTILQACLAEAESRGEEQGGNHYARFIERLAASVAIDNRLKPTTFGHNGNGPVCYPREPGLVTYMGVQY